MVEKIVWLEKGERVNATAAVAHHHATLHLMSGFGAEAYCDGCPFAVEEGIVTERGLAMFRSPDEGQNP